MVRACTGLVWVRSTRPESSGRDEEGVHHRAGRVVAADVERVEVQPLRLELRAVGDLVAHAHEDVGDPLGQRRERVPGAARGAVPGQRDVDPLLGQHAGVALGLQLGQPRLVRLLRPPARAALTRLPASLRAAGGSAPSSRRASSTGARSPRWAGRTAASPSRSPAPRTPSARRSTASSSASGRERGDLLGVVGIVGARHGRPFCPAAPAPRPGLMARASVAVAARPGSAHGVLAHGRQLRPDAHDQVT